MGHRAKMTSNDRIQWDIAQYQAQRVAKRGHNYKYLTDDLGKELSEKGYTQHAFTDGRHTTMMEHIARGVVDDLRGAGYYARIICISNRLRVREYAIFSKLINPS